MEGVGRDLRGVIELTINIRIVSGLEISFGWMSGLHVLMLWPVM